IKLLRNTIVKKEGSRLKVSDLNNKIEKMSRSSLSRQNINQLVKLNFDAHTVLNDGYKHWVDLDWKTIQEENNIIPNDKEISELIYEDDQDDWIPEEDDEL
ncbi:DNA primase, partial [Escherichia coli]